jgi:hypothetical protein
MQKITLELSEKQAEQVLQQLSQPVKIRLVRRFEQETWPQRLRDLLTRIDRRVKRHPRLFDRAMKVVQPVRRASYARRH